MAKAGKVAKRFNTVIWWHTCICVHIDVGVTPAPKDVDFFALILLDRPKVNTTLAKITQHCFSSWIIPDQTISLHMLSTA